MDKNKIQAVLGGGVGAVIVILVVTENLQLYPETFNWSWLQNVYANNFYPILATAVLYYPVIFGYLRDQRLHLCSSYPKLSCSHFFTVLSPRRLCHRIKYYLEDKESFDLGGAKTKCLINWIFWWEAGLALFSIVGAYYTVPPVLNDYLQGKSFVEVVCSTSKHILNTPRAGFWTSLFCVSCASVNPKGYHRRGEHVWCASESVQEESKHTIPNCKTD